MACSRAWCGPCQRAPHRGGPRHRGGTLGLVLAPSGAGCPTPPCHWARRVGRLCRECRRTACSGGRCCSRTGAQGKEAEEGGRLGSLGTAGRDQCSACNGARGCATFCFGLVLGGGLLYGGLLSLSPVWGEACGATLERGSVCGGEAGLLAVLPFKQPDQLCVVHRHRRDAVSLVRRRRPVR